MCTGLSVMPLSAVEPDVLVELAKQGHPFTRPRGQSDYWLYGRLFSSTCKVAILDDCPVGFIVSFRNQDNPEELYIQDLAVHQKAEGRESQPPCLRRFCHPLRRSAANVHGSQANSTTMPPIGLGAEAASPTLPPTAKLGSSG